jgi:hypothetical protein
VINDLKQRGVQDILIACIDSLKGFDEAIRTIYPLSEIQTCVAYQIRNSLKYVASKDQKLFMAELKPVYRAGNEPAALDEPPCSLNGAVTASFKLEQYYFLTQFITDPGRLEKYLCPLFVPLYLQTLYQ